MRILHIIDTALSLISTYDDDDEPLIIADYGLVNTDGNYPNRILNEMLPPPQEELKADATTSPSHVVHDDRASNKNVDDAREQHSSA